MKRRMKISIIAITCLGVLSPISAFADNPLDKLIPRGTLFKKLKQEIAEEFGGDKAKTPTPRRAPTPAVRADDWQRQSSANSRSTQSRQAAQRNQKRRQPTLATRPLPPMNQRSKALTDRSSRSAQNSAQRPIQPVGIGAASGFGVIVQMAKNNDMVVTRVHPQGNAVKAGLKPGDIVKTVGSVKLTSIEEYDQITKDLRPGDQMEFEVVRRGRPEKALVQFGTVPAEPQIANSSTVPAIEAPVSNYRESPIALNGVPSVLDNSAQPAARVSRLPQATPASVSGTSEIERRLSRTIESQRAKMQRMEQELEMLRKTTTPAIAPIENNWALPEISSPN